MKSIGSRLAQPEKQTMTSNALIPILMLFTLGAGLLIAIVLLMLFCANLATVIRWTGNRNAISRKSAWRAGIFSFVPRHQILSLITVTTP